MSYLDALLVAQARAAGRAVRSATVRHRHIADRPLAVVFWQLGAEPFTAAAVGWGFDAKSRKLAVPGEPRDRTLAFRALTILARDFNQWFENAATTDGDVPQIILPNGGNLAMLGRLGRRLAYLPTDGERPADPELVRFGRHLGFLFDRSRHPGQQLVLVLTDLLRTHWASELSDMETQSLPALDAMIDPPRGKTGHEAAARAERLEIGPVPGRADDEALAEKLQVFNDARARGTDEALVAPLRKPIEEHYAELIDRAWPLIWRCVDRERRLPEAPSVARRWVDDGEALGRHLDWVVGKGGRYRTRETSRQAAWKLHSWEEAAAVLEAEEALDDPLRMVPALLNNQAITGTVVDVDMENRELGTKNRILRPLITLESNMPVLLPLETELFWTGAPDGTSYSVREIREQKKTGRWRVVLVHWSPGKKVVRPTVGEQATFSIYSTKAGHWFKLPDDVPWTHRPKTPDPVTTDIESPEDLA